MCENITWLSSDNTFAFTSFFTSLINAGGGFKGSPCRKLLTEYGVGGNFLKVSQALYDKHQVYVRVSDGLLQQIQTTVGLI